MRPALDCLSFFPSSSPFKVCYRRWLEEKKEEEDAIDINCSGNLAPPADEAARAALTPDEGKPPPQKKMRPTMMPQNGRKGGLASDKSSIKPMARWGPRSCDAPLHPRAASPMNLPLGGGSGKHRPIILMALCS